MVGFMILAGLAEGVSVVTLIPVLEIAGGGGTASSGVGRVVVDGVRALGLEPTLGVLLAAIVIAMGLRALTLLLANRQVGYTVAQVTRDLRLELMRGLLDVRWPYFASRSTGQFANSTLTEANRSAQAYEEACEVLAASLQIAAYLSVSTLISWQVTLAAVLAGVTLTFLFRRFFADSHAAGRTQTALSKSLASRLVDVLRGIKPLKAMAREDLVWPLLEQETQGLNEAQQRTVRAVETMRSFQEPAMAAMLALGLYWIIGVRGQPVPTVLVLIFVFYRIMTNVNTLQLRYQTVVQGESAFWSLRDESDSIAKEREEDRGGLDLGRLREGIRFEGVRFAYDERPVLDGVDLDIPAGSFVAIAGESGSGKTTLADLVAGLYVPDEGRILVDGVPLSELSLSAWRRKIGYVPQEMLLFNDTIMRNVSLGDERITRQDVESALRAAGAWDFVGEKDGQLDHHIGEGGGMLSGGQRQRIAIARALVTEPSLLILDEVTTALDPVTERAICSTLKKLSGGVTILSISHQPALRAVADIVHVMRNGKLHPAEETPPVGDSVG
jgi:ATP-binding cassette subfamily C protein